MHIAHPCKRERHGLTAGAKQVLRGFRKAGMWAALANSSSDQQYWELWHAVLYLLLLGSAFVHLPYPLFAPTELSCFGDLSISVNTTHIVAFWRQPALTTTRAYIAESTVFGIAIICFINIVFKFIPFYF